MPAAGYELEPLRVEGISRSNPLKAARAVLRAARRVGAARTDPRAPRRRRRARRRRLRRGPGRARGADPAHPARADRGRLAPRPHQPPAGAARAPRLPRVPDRGPRRRPLPRHRPPRAARRSATAPRARAAVRHPARGDLRARSSAARSARARSTSRRSRRSPDAPFHVLHVPGSRDFAELARARRRTTTCASTCRPFGQALAAADLAVARAGGSVFELAQYGLPAILIPYPHASADHQTANARWMAEAGAADDPARRRAQPAAAARRGRRDCSPTPSGCAGMAAASRRLARPDAAATVAAEVLAAPPS